MSQSFNGSKFAVWSGASPGLYLPRLPLSDGHGVVPYEVMKILLKLELAVRRLRCVLLMRRSSGSRTSSTWKGHAFPRQTVSCSRRSTVNLATRTPSSSL